jgi:multiple sugar transport system substrate-binding protein
MPMSNSNQKFTIAVRKFGPFESAMQKFWDQYCAYSGCKLKLELKVMDLHELHQSTLTAQGLHRGDFDVAHINTDWIYEGYQSGAFEILNPYLENNPPTDFPKGWSNSLLGLQQFEGNIVGLPFHDGPECLIYRKDLFESHIEQAAYASKYGKQLMVPKTWGDFYQIAEFFNRPESNLYGTIFACFPDGHNTVFDFCLQLWTRGGNLVDPAGAIQLDTNEACEALDFYRKIVNDQKAVHPGSAAFDSVAAGLAFSRGEAAMMINWFGFATMCDVESNSKVKGKVYVDLLPSNPDQTSASLNVYWLYTIGSGSSHKEVAYDFLRFAIGTEQDKMLTLEGGIGCRISTWNDTEINNLIPYYHKLETLHVVAKMLPQKQNWSEIAKIIDKMVLDAMHGNEPSSKLLQLAQQQINLIDQ